jgi:hypothetical protein
LTALNRLSGDGGETQATSGGWFLRDCDGKRLAVEDEDGQPASLTLASHATVCMSLVISDLSEAGSYKAKLSVSSPGGAEESAEVIVRLRDHFFLAALLIFLGALASYRLRHWLEIGRPMQISQLAIGRLMQQVRDKIANGDDAVRQALLARLEEVQQLQQVDPNTNVETTLGEVRTGLNDYLAVRAVFDLEADLKAIVPNPQHRAEAERELQCIKQLLLAGDDLLAALAQAEESAEALRAKIDGWSQARLRDGIQKLRGAVQADLERLKTLAVGEDQKTALRETLEALQGRLSTAAGQVESSIDDAQALYEQARATYAQAGVARLRLVLEGQPHPLGFTDAASWVQVRDGLLQELAEAEEQDPGEARQTVERVRKQYLETMISRLQAATRELVGQLKKKPGTEQQQAALAQVVQDLEAALPKVAGDPDGAEAAYRQARDDYLAQLPDERRGQLQDAEGRPAPGAPAQSPGGGLDPGGPSADRAAEGERVGEELSPARIIEVIRRKDRQALFIVSGVSVLVGLQALWVPNSTFGGLVDYITVFLWGFGLHELNKVALPAAARRLELPWYPQTEQPSEG